MHGARGSCLNKQKGAKTTGDCEVRLGGKAAKVPHVCVCVNVCVKLVVLETGSNSAQVRQATQRCDMRNLVVGVSRSDIANSEDF